MKILNPAFWIIIFMVLMQSVCTGQIEADTLRTVRMTALANHQPLSLTIQWEDDPGPNTYRLYKKLRQDTTWGDFLILTADQDTSFIDTDIEEGKLYEYRIIKQTSGDSLGYGYLLSGVNYVPPQKRGDILLLVDSAALDFVVDNLNNYMEVLISEGWIPWLVPVSEYAPVQEVKSLILQYYNEIDSLTAVLLMGNIAVVHSGNVNPDGHTNHKGAWPADLYYGDMDGLWTDETVNNTSSIFPRVHNIPGDGKFDQDYIPGEIELAVGRFDFSELPVFGLNQYELLNNYLEKNIAYRTGEYQVRRRAVLKNTNLWGEGLGQNGIRNFVPLVSPDSIVNGDYFEAFDDSFLWAYGGGSGTMTSGTGLGNIDTYANGNFQTVFTGYFGSYFGDYDFENNFLRTILASGKVLSTAWVGAPNWFFHPMGMGMDLGFCTLLTQNNTDVYYAGYFPQYVTINLLGDPTLKAYILRPPQDLSGTQNGNHLELSWSPSAEDNLLGYQVCKKTEGMDYFAALNLVPASESSFTDSCVTGGESLQYLIKAVKREITPSGSFINYSTGPVISIQTEPNIYPEADFNLSWEQGVLNGENLSANADQYQWTLPDGTSVPEENFEIPYNQSGEISVTLIASNACFSDTLQQVLVITGTTNPTAEKDIEIYPNPAKGFVTLETSVIVDELHLYNILGIHMLVEYNLVSGTHTINMQNLAAGTYLLKIHLKNQVIPEMIVLSK